MKIKAAGAVVGYHFDHMEDGEICWAIQDNFYVTNPDARSDNVIHVQPLEVVVEVPDTINIVAAQVAALEREKIKVLEAYQRTVAQINERLSKLQAITNEVAQ